MKALFIIGQCLRLLNTDPWDGFTYHIQSVGQNSYLTQSAIQENKAEWGIKTDGRTIYFKNQKEYEVVECPNLDW